MFSLFNSNNQKSGINQHLREFQDQFSENQRKAIMSCLFIIANLDGEFHRKEEKFFIEAASVLGYKLSGDYLDDFMSMGGEKLINILNSLDDSQKDWFIIAAYVMVHADGQALDYEFQCLESQLNIMGITRQRFEDVVSKSQLLMNK